MKMCYRGVHYDYTPVLFDLNEQQRYSIERRLNNTKTIQTKFLGSFCYKKAVKLLVTQRKTRFLGQVKNCTTVS